MRFEGRSNQSTLGRTRPYLEAVAPALVYFAVRATGLAILWVLARARGDDPVEELNSYDGLWLVDIARFG